MEKYVVYLDTMADEGGEAPVIAIKYDHARKRVDIGGYSRFRRNILAVIDNFFPCEVARKLEESAPQRNKVKYSFVLASREVYAGLAKMEASGIVLKNVKSLQRIMR